MTKYFFLTIPESKRMQACRSLKLPSRGKKHYRDVQCWGEIFSEMDIFAYAAGLDPLYSETKGGTYYASESPDYEILAGMPKWVKWQELRPTLGMEAMYLRSK